MAGNSFGNLFRITTFGESHGGSIGVVVDGCPAGLAISSDDIQRQLNRRRPGQNAITSPRNETDIVQILSGIFEGKTLGTPIAMLIPNKDARPNDYDHLKEPYRPSHADFTWDAKFGHRDHRGGGRSSARETAARVAAGAIAGKLIAHYGIRVYAYVSRVAHVICESLATEVELQNIDANDVRCPIANKADQMIQAIEEARDSGDSLGGIITCIVKNCPPGLGEPVFDKLHAKLGQAMLSINACKGFDIGSGFDGVGMRGSEHNDAFIKAGSKIRTSSNRSGGVQGGISNGMDIVFRAAFKPVATIQKEQQTLNKSGETVTIQGKGRHDPCVLPRAVPIVEAMTNLVLADALLFNRLNKL